jgi:hypothetical protein
MRRSGNELVKSKMLSAITYNDDWQRLYLKFRSGDICCYSHIRGGSGANSSVSGDDDRMQRFVPVEALFKGRHFDGQIIILCVSWYTSFKLSLRDLVIMMADRGITLTHTTILRWVQHYLPEFEKRWTRYTRPVGGSWRMDETYIKVRGSWVYLYRAVDKAGRTVDFFLSRNRDVKAAKTFLRIAQCGK